MGEILGYKNKRLYSFRRARMKQAGEHTTTGNPYYPSQQQDIISAKRFVEDLTGPEAAARAQRAAEQEREKRANLMAGQALASTQGIIKTQTTVYKQFLAVAGSISIVPQNYNRIFLLFCLTNRPAGVNCIATFSFGPPQFGSNGGRVGGIELYNLTNAAVTDVLHFKPNELMNSSVIPTDEIFVTTNIPSMGVMVYEGNPIT
jgi:hypothetical protein